MYIICIFLHYSNDLVRALVSEAVEQTLASAKLLHPVSHPNRYGIEDVIHAVAVGNDEELFAFSVSEVAFAGVRFWLGSAVFA